jgi:hypothetical protein
VDDGPAFPFSPRQAAAVVLLLVGLGVFAVGLFAVGPGRFYLGDTWPDFLVILAASLLIVTPIVDLAARDALGTWSWRTLRRRSVVGLGLAFVLLFVLSASVPAETGISPVGDSAQGLSMYTFAESLLVTLVAVVKSPRGRGVTPLAWDAFTARADAAGPRSRIELRRWPLVSRDSYVEVDRVGATFVIPRLFGGRRAWFVPMSTIGVELPGPSGPNRSPDPLADEEWVTREEFRVPYLSTTSAFAPPNLTLLFTVSHRIAPIRRFADADLGLSGSATRSAEGVMVDGVELRVVDPEAARQALIASGAQAVTDRDAFVKHHRDVLHDPEKVRAITSAARWWPVQAVVSLVLMVGLLIAFKVTDDGRYGLGLAAVFGVSALIDRWMRRRLEP